MTVQIQSSDRILVDSRLFGTLSLPADSAFMFRRGLAGFSGVNRFALLPAAHPGVTWIHGIDDPSLVFLTINPYEFVDGYQLDLRPSDRRSAGIGEDIQPTVLGVVTLPQGIVGTSTVNLEAPIAIDSDRRSGAQILIPDCPYGSRHPVKLSLRAETAIQVHSTFDR